MTDNEPGTPYPVTGVPNLRDLGGWQVPDHREVLRGKVFRSTELHRLDADAHMEFDRLGIRTVYDLRTLAERTASPDPHLTGITEVVLDVLADAATAIPANLAMLADPSAIPAVSAALGGGRASALMTETYRQIVSSPSALAAYRSLFEGLAGDHKGPSLFHCTTGKDRTGWAAAALLSILGVDRSDIYHDYLLTNDQLVPALRPIFDQFAAAGGDPDLLLPVLGVERSYLETAFSEMEEAFGDIEGYFRQGLGVDDSVPTALRARLVRTT
ncbi:protein-tyrosine-phosphatase [Williamsia sp. 1138]|uniref:tyrosine-protein phosphatase n=1 Tax=Williamsia sp. 1138 TaxID=1903117 RepID=UPI000A102FC9|nr:tyrosine-protein phosphatase [Williamsia sp. 1138]OZG26161.1 protein-tyrosine-phosphatase [Williamsia sp. 1138]